MSSNMSLYNYMEGLNSKSKNIEAGGSPKGRYFFGTPNSFGWSYLELIHFMIQISIKEDSRKRKRYFRKG